MMTNSNLQHEEIVLAHELADLLKQDEVVHPMQPTGLSKEQNVDALLASSGSDVSLLVAPTGTSLFFLSHILR